MDIAAWLRGLGLAQYELMFRENDVDGQVLPRLTADDLISIGVTSVGHRRRLLDAIASLAGEAPAARASPVRADPERRQLTVMFCDLVGSTPLATRLDPEDLRGILGAYHRCVTEIVEGFGGFVARYMGDGVLVYFGYPQAHEVDAERATRCGLALVDRVPQLNQGEELHARVGIATGLVVVGGEVVEHDVAGDTPNLAARLQALAEPDTVMIAASTRRLTGDLFEYQDLGQIELKGISDPVRTWQVLRPSVVESRFEAFHAASLTPLVGREEEIELLLRRWAQAKDGNGQIVLVSGEAGIGKSRLSAVLQERLGGEPHIRLRYFCSPHHADSPLHPVIAQLERAAGFVREDPPGTRLDKLETLLAQSGEKTPEAVALVADLLAVTNDGRYPPLPSDPRRQREETFATLVRQLQGLTRGQPVLVIFEDAHWSDSTTLELLDIILARVPRLRVLFVVTFRPEFRPPWIGEAYVTFLTLGRLGERETAALAERVAGGKALPSEILVQIVERADGIPLFTEELTKALLEGGLLREEGERYLFEGQSPAIAIPSSLHASLLARLDRLAPVREVAQIGAVLGREFSYETLAAVAGRSDTELVDALDQLVDAGLIFRRGGSLRATFTFKHALIQDAAYSTLLRSQRQGLHARIGNMLKERFPEIAVAEPETLAHHYTEAGLVDLAIDYWHKAGERALRRSAIVEAVQHLTHGIELTRSLPATPARDRRELDLYLALGRFIRVAKGLAAPETLQVFTRARQLLDDNATVTEHMTVLYGLWGVRYVRAEHSEARDVARQCLDLAARYKHNSAAGVLANYIMGDTLWATGDFIGARGHLERTLQLGAAAGAGSSGARELQNHDINALSYLAWTLWPLGYPQQAAAAAHQAVERARDIGHVPLIAFVSFVDAFLAAAFGADRNRREARFEAAVTYCVEHGVRAYELWIRFCHGVAAARRDPERGIAVMLSSIAELDAINAEILRPLHLGHLAAARASLRDAEAGLALTDAALATVEKTGERLFEAELYRLRGELELSLGRTEAAETALLRALTVARGQEARMWELRAAVSVARLRCDQGHRAEARELLAPVYGWFTEGFDTPDLEEAKTLLAELIS